MSQIEDVLRALDVIGTDSWIEIAQTETGAHKRVDGQIDAANVIDIVAAFRRWHSSRVKTDEEIEAIETDFCFLFPGQTLVLASQTKRN